MPETRKYTVVDLFAGVGGLSYGFSRNDRFEIILANEMQKDIAKAYTLNHPLVNMLQGDIKDLSEDILRQAIGNRTVDVVVGGPPCQSYSTLGKRQMDARANLFMEYKRVLCILHPRAFLFENVKGILSMDKGALFEHVRKEFEDIGYSLQYKILNAVDYGVPQLRERVILVGFLGENAFQYPEPTHGEGLLPYVTLQDALKDLPALSCGEKRTVYERNTVTAPSSAALILQIWLHTICLWKRRCLSRKVEQRIVHANGEQESVKDVRECLNTSKQTIVDLKKGIVVYVNDGRGKRSFAGFCVLQSERCGHFRHLQSGRVVYVRPTTVHYKKLNPNKAISQTAKPVIYRNTEDFLREKSYLENDVLMMLKCNGIEYQREKMFPWMGKKRLDFFLPGKNIAIECQGVQHFYPYGNDDGDFEARKQRDIDKYNECTSNGVQVLYYMSELIPVPDEMARKYRYVTSLDELLGILNEK